MVLYCMFVFLKDFRALRGAEPRFGSDAFLSPFHVDFYA